jgi:hypothetical protein
MQLKNVEEAIVDGIQRAVARQLRRHQRRKSRSLVSLRATDDGARANAVDVISSSRNTKAEGGVA